MGKSVFTHASVKFYKLLIITVSKLTATIKSRSEKYNIMDDPKLKKKKYVEIFVYLVAAASINKSTLCSGLSNAE